MDLEWIDNMTDWELDADELHLIRQEKARYVSPTEWRSRGTKDAIDNVKPRSGNRDYLIGYGLGCRLNSGRYKE